MSTIGLQIRVSRSFVGTLGKVGQEEVSTGRKEVDCDGGSDVFLLVRVRLVFVDTLL